MSPGTRGAAARKQQRDRSNNANNNSAGNETPRDATTTANRFAELEEEDRIEQEDERGQDGVMEERRGEDDDETNGTEDTSVTKSIDMIQSQLASLTKTLSELQKRVTQPPPPPPPAPDLTELGATIATETATAVADALARNKSSPPRTTSKQTTAKLLPPDNYDGDATTFRRFAEQARTYVEFYNASNTQTELTQILRNSLSGPAADWARMAMDNARDAGQTTAWTTAAQFINELKSVFADPNETFAAYARMGRMKIDEYEDWAAFVTELRALFAILPISPPMKAYAMVNTLTAPMITQLATQPAWTQWQTHPARMTAAEFELLVKAAERCYNTVMVAADKSMSSSTSSHASGEHSPVSTLSPTFSRPYAYSRSKPRATGLTKHGKEALLYGIMSQYRTKLGAQRFRELKDKRLCFNCGGDVSECGGAGRCTKPARVNVVLDDALDAFNVRDPSVLLQAGMERFGDDLAPEDDTANMPDTVAAIMMQMDTDFLATIYDAPVYTTCMHMTDNIAWCDDTVTGAEKACQSYSALNQLMHVDIQWNGYKLPVMVDSGATITCMSLAAARQLSLDIRPSTRPITLGKGTAYVYGVTTLHDVHIDTAFGLHGVDAIDVQVVDGLSLPFILGLDVMHAENLVVETRAGLVYHASKMSSRVAQIQPLSLLASRDDIPASAVFSLSVADILAADTTDLGLPAEDVQRATLLGDAILLNDDEEMRALCRRHSRIFGRLTELPPRRGEFDAIIDLVPGATPHFSPNRANSAQDRADTTRVINNWLQMDLVESNNVSGWTAPIHFPPRRKKDGHRRETWDCRKNNSYIRLNQYPMPAIAAKTKELAASRFFTLLDCPSAFHQMRIAAGHEDRMILATPLGNFASRIAQMGMKNSAQQWQRLVDAILQGNAGALPRWPADHPRHEEGERRYRDKQQNGYEDLRGIAVAYMDDIVIHSKTIDEHKQHVAKVLQRFDDYALLVKAITKFGATRIEFLGHEIENGKTRPLKDKTKAISEWPIPSTPKEMRTLLGVLNFYRPYVPSMASYTSLLTPYTTGVPTRHIDVDEDARAAITKLKKEMANAVELALPDPEREFIVVSDASVYAIGGALLQTDDEGTLQPIEFFSRQTTLPESKYGQYKLELLALCACLKHWATYLVGKHVVAFTDHKPLVTGSILHELNGHEPTGKVIRLVSDVQHLQVDLRHHAATEKLAQLADSLTRRADYVSTEGRDLRSWIHSIEKHIQNRPAEPPSHVVEVAEMRVTPIMDTARDIRITDMTPDRARALLADFSPAECETMKKKGYTEREDGIWTHAGRIVVPQNPELRAAIIADAHGPSHRGATATGRVVAQQFFWPGMYADIAQRVRECLTCATQKRGQRVPAPPIPRTPPSHAWQEVELDFIEALPPSHGYTRILTCVCTYTKQCVLVPCSTMDADEFATLFIKHIWSKHGMPRIVRSDCDTLLLSSAWRAVCTIAGIEPETASPYHHQANGLAERMNQQIEQLLRLLVDQDSIDTEWSSAIPAVEFFINATPTDTTGIAPFVAATFRMPRTGWGLDIVPTADGDAMDIDGGFIDNVHTRIRTMLNRAEAARAHGATPMREFAIGDSVLLSTADLHGQPGLASDPRLRARYIGPFRIEQKLGLRTYKLGLPPTMKIRNVIDIDRIIAYHGPHADHTEPDVIENELGYEIDYIVELRGRRERGRIVKDKCVVHWKGFTDDYDTLHDITDILQDAPYVLKRFVDAQRRRPLLDADVDAALRALPPEPTSATLHFIAGPHVVPHNY